MSNSRIIRIILLAGIVILINVVSKFLFTSVDLTADKRFTMTEKTKELIPQVKENMTVKIFLEGENFPAGFRRLRSQVEQFMKQLRKLNPKIQYEFLDPLSGTLEEQQGRVIEMQKDGIDPVRLTVSDGASSSEQRTFPYAQILYGSRVVSVNLLESQSPGQPQEIILNNSAALLEYKLTNSIQHLIKKSKPNLVFIEGHGELALQQTAALERELRKFYDTGHMRLDSIVNISSEIDAVIVAKPKKAFSERDKFLIDQYVMNGGNMLWMVDRLDASLDSISRHGVYVPSEYELNLDDLWFKWGFRPNADLVLDIESTRIPLQVGQMGGKPKYELFPWFYHPLVGPRTKHPIGINLDRVNLMFAGSIDTVRTALPVKKTALLLSSPYTRIQRSPMRLGFDMAHDKPDPDKFPRANVPMAWLLEGQFSSLYKNRVPQSFLDALNKMDLNYKEASSGSKIVVVSDGDIAKNLFRADSRQFSAIGFNKYENRVVGGNRDFVINAIDYLVDENGIMESRNKELKLRILDSVRTDKEKGKWQFINIALPLLIFLLLGILNHFWRKKKYTV